VIITSTLFFPQMWLMDGDNHYKSKFKWGFLFMDMVVCHFFCLEEKCWFLTWIKLIWISMCFKW
jgi:hypothetical protein